MTVISLTRGGAAAAAGVTPPRRRRGRVALARIGGGLAVLVPIVFLVSFITYCLGALSNSNPAATILGQDAATPAAVARLDKALSLDHSLLAQYWNWLVQAVHGNLGRSYFTQIPVSQSVAQRLPVDLSIAILAVILAVLIGGTAGTVAAIRRGGWFDREVTAVCSVVSTLPAFVVGIILVVLFAVSVHAFPANGYVGPISGIGPWLSHIMVTHRHVDVATMVEITTPQGLFGLPHVLRDADVRDVPDLAAELHRVKREPSASRSGRLLEQAAPIATRIPGAVPAIYAVMARSVAVRQRVGTVAVTAVGMFAGGGGFGLTAPAMMSLEVVVGGTTQRPRAVGGQVAVRDVLDLTVVIDHNVVDGAPASRFGAELRELIESAAVISPSS